MSSSNLIINNTVYNAYRGISTTGLNNQIIGNNDHKEYEIITEIITTPTYYSQGKCYEIKRCKACGYEYSKTIKMMDRLVENTNENINNSGKNDSTINTNNGTTNNSNNNNNNNTNVSNNVIKVGNVSGLKNKTQDQKSITVKWNKIPDATGYELEKYDTSKKKYVNIKTLTDISNKVTGLKVATTYKFRVRAYKIVKGIKYYGNYSDVIKLTTKTKTPSISKLTAGKKKVTVKYKKVSGASGYQIQYSANSKFKKVNKSTNTTKLSKTVKSLKSKKKYYVRIRTYRNINGKKIYSSWSKAKYIKVK